MKKYRFVLHQHKAKRAGLHYDLRIENDKGTLDSYAIRKNPLQLAKGQKILIIPQPEHEKKWLKFEGVLPEGYGAGTLKILDSGYAEKVKDTETVKTYNFQGKKLKGYYSIVHTGNFYLLVRHKHEPITEQTTLTEEPIVVYRYVITMPNREKPLHQFIEDLVNKHLTELYQGKFAVLTSPFLYSSKYYYVQPILDTDARDLHQNISLARKLIQRYRFLQAEYTGKTGFHLASRILIRFPKEITPIEIREEIMRHWQLPPQIDVVTSFRNVPIIRIGYRIDVKAMAFPVRIGKRNLADFILKHQKDNGFENIMSKDELEDYLRERLIPNRVITPDQFRKLVR